MFLYENDLSSISICSYLMNVHWSSKLKVVENNLLNDLIDFLVINLLDSCSLYSDDEIVHRVLNFRVQRYSTMNLNWHSESMNQL